MEFLTVVTVEEVKKLVDLGYDVNYIDEQKDSVLYHACDKGNVNVVKVLCEAGANVNYVNPYGRSILYFVSYYGYIDVLDYLLTLNLELTSLNNKYYNPLRCAIAKGNIDVVDRLLYAGADANVYYDGFTPMLIATRNNRLDIIKKLVMFGANYHLNGGELLLFSCVRSYDDISEFLIHLGVNLNCYIDNMTPLMHTCKNNNFKIVKLLLERCADPHFVNDDGEKAIDYCKSDEVRALFIKN